LIGISGYGRIHLNLAKQWRDRGAATIVAATVINAEEEAEEVAGLHAGGCEIFPDYEQMLTAHAGRIDLCMIPTGIHWHARMTIAALRAGANVLVEKPLSGVMSEVAAVRAAEREAGRFVAVGFQDYYEPGTAWLKQHLLDGAIGRVQSVRFLGLWPRPRSYFLRNEWAGRLLYDGRPVFDSPLSNAFAHFVMLSLYFAGERLEQPAVARLVAAELFRAHAIETFDTAVARLESESGVALWFGVSHACRTLQEPEIVIEGTAGRAGWRYEREAWWCGADGVEHRRELPDAFGARHDMMVAVVARLRDATVAICTPEIAGVHTAVIESLHADIPVQGWGAEDIQWTPGVSAEGAIPWVAGLDETLRRAYEQGGSLASAGFTLPLASGV
jgi:predicted dehydrogenase